MFVFGSTRFSATITSFVLYLLFMRELAGDATVPRPGSAPGRVRPGESADSPG